VKPSCSVRTSKYLCKVALSFASFRPATQGCPPRRTPTSHSFSDNVRSRTHTRFPNFFSFVFFVEICGTPCLYTIWSSYRACGQVLLASEPHSSPRVGILAGLEMTFHQKIFPGPDIPTLNMPLRTCLYIPSHTTVDIIFVQDNNPQLRCDCPHPRRSSAASSICGSRSPECRSFSRQVVKSLTKYLLGRESLPLHWGLDWIRLLFHCRRYTRQ
jgi:hypothetical protein